MDVEYFLRSQLPGDWMTHSSDGQTVLYDRSTSTGWWSSDGARTGTFINASKICLAMERTVLEPLYDTFPSTSTVVADIPPTARLVGIELNPGPIQSGPLPSSSSSTASHSDSSITHPITASPNDLASFSSRHSSLTWSERTDWISERNEWNRLNPTSVYLGVLMDAADLVKDVAEIVLTYLEPPHYYQPYDHGRPCEPGSYLIPLPRAARPLAVAFQLKLKNRKPMVFISPSEYIITQFHGKSMKKAQEDHDNQLDLDCSTTQPTSSPTTYTASRMPSGWSYRATDQIGVIELISNSTPPSNKIGYGILLGHLKPDDQMVQLCHMFPSNWSHLSSFQLRRPAAANRFLSPFFTFTFFYTIPPTKHTLSATKTTTTSSIHLDTPCLSLPCGCPSLRQCQRNADGLLLSHPFTCIAHTCHLDASGVPSTIEGDRSPEELRWSYQQAARKGVEAVQQLSHELKTTGEAMLLERAALFARHSDLYLDDGSELPSDDWTTSDAAFDQLMHDYVKTWVSNRPFSARMELHQAHQTIAKLNATISNKEMELSALKDHYEKVAIPNLVNTYEQQIKKYVTQVSDLTNRLRSFEDERRLDSNLGPSGLTNSTPIIQIFPQTMFTDGLHLISTYLDERDFVASLQVCHHWADSFSSSPSRSMSYPIEMDGSFRSLPHMRLRHHFTQLRARRILPEMTMKQLFAIGREFPYLNQFLSLRILPRDTLSMVNFWPEGLKELVIDLDDFISPQLIQTISTCISLVRLSLSRVSQYEDFSLFQSYEQLIHLEYFQLTGYSPGDIDLLSLIRWCSGPPNLRVLKFSSNFFSLTTFIQLRVWPILEEIQKLPTVLKEGELELIVLSVPNLRVIQLEICPLSDFVLLKQFQSLHTLRLWSSVRPDESEKIQAICNCSQLTSLEFTHDPPQLSSSWVQLSRLNLVELSFFASCSPNPLDVLLPFQSLTKLVFEETDSESSTYVRDYFRSPMVMPQLYHIEIRGVFTDWMNWIWRKDGQNNTVLGDQFREPPQQTQRTTNQTPTTSTSTIAREPPQEDLTIHGIEPNPGPTPECSITFTTITAQTIFKDALHLIYSYDTLSSVATFMLVCKHWYDCGRSIPCRHLKVYTDMHPSNEDIPAAAAGGLSSCTPSDLLSLFTHQRPPPPIHFRHHFTSLSRRPGPPPPTMNGNQLCWIMAYYSSLTHIACAVRGDATSLRDCQWPNSLTHLSLELETPNCPNVILSLTQQLSSNLQYLALSGLNEPNLDGLSNLQHFESLTHLSLHDSWGGESIDFIRRAPWSSLPQSLTYLDLCCGYDQALASIHSVPPLINLTYLELSRRYIFTPGDLWRYFNFAPNLRILAPNSIYPPLHCLSLFRSLDTIHIKCTLYDLNDCKLVSYLAACPSLTHLQFDECNLHTRDSWVALARDLPQLRVFETALTKTSIQHFIQVLTPAAFIHLERLIALYHPCQQLKDHLNNPNICPKLTALTLGTRMRGQCFNFDSIHGLHTDDYRLRIKVNGST